MINNVNAFLFGGNDLSNRIFPNNHITNTGTCNPVTHFVSAITYRAGVFITFEETYKSFFERDAIKLKFAGVKIADKAKVKAKEFEITSVKLIGMLIYNEKYQPIYQKPLNLYEIHHQLSLMKCL